MLPPTGSPRGSKGRTTENVPIAPGGITEEHREARPQTPSFSEPPAGGGHDRRTAPVRRLTRPAGSTRRRRQLRDGGRSTPARCSSKLYNANGVLCVSLTFEWSRSGTEEDVTLVQGTAAAQLQLCKVLGRPDQLPWTIHACTMFAHPSPRL